MKTIIKLRLFVTGESEMATRAIENLKAACDDPVIQQKYDIQTEVININDSPDVAEEDNILVTPTLLKKLPLPMRRLVGDLSNVRDVFFTLDVDEPARGDSRIDKDAG